MAQSALEERPHVLVRTARPSDVVQLARVDILSWRGAYDGIFPDSELAKLSLKRRQTQWSRRLDHHSPNRLTLVAEVDGRVVGFAYAGTARRERQSAGEIYEMYVLPQWWGYGVGTALMDITLSWLAPRFDRAVLWVVRENTGARRFYEARGFRWKRDSFRVFIFFDAMVQCVQYALDLGYYDSPDWHEAFMR